MLIKGPETNGLPGVYTLPLLTGQPTHYLVKFSLHTLKKRTAPLVWLLAGMMLLFPVSAHVLSGIVLCIESDGRVEIENGRFGDCASRVFARVQEVHADYAALEANEASGTICPTSCLDFLLFASPHDGQVMAKLKDASRIFKDLSPVVAPHPVPGFDTSKPLYLAVKPAGPPSPLTPLRTVVLLI